MRRRTLLATGGSLFTSVFAGCGETQSSTGTTPEETEVKKLEVVTPEPTPSPSPTPSPIQCPGSAPSYTVHDVSDISYGDVVRVRVDIELYSIGDNLSDEEFHRLSQDVVCRVISEIAVNAIAIFYWEAGQRPGYETAYASNDWAPYGEWSQADAVETGDYSKHEHDFERL